MYRLHSHPTPAEIKELKKDHDLTYGNVGDLICVSASAIKKWAGGIGRMPIGLWQLWLLRLGEIELKDLI